MIIRMKLKWIFTELHSIVSQAVISSTYSHPYLASVKSCSWLISDHHLNYNMKLCITSNLIPVSLYIRNCRPNVSERSTYIAQLFSVLVYLEKCGYIHHNLSMDVLAINMDSEPHLQLLDCRSVGLLGFECDSCVRSHPDPESYNDCNSSINYRDVRNVNVLCSLWAFGVTIIEMVCQCNFYVLAGPLESNIPSSTLQFGKGCKVWFDILPVSVIGWLSVLEVILCPRKFRMKSYDQLQKLEPLVSLKEWQKSGQYKSHCEIKSKIPDILESDVKLLMNNLLPQLSHDSPIVHRLAILLARHYFITYYAEVYLHSCNNDVQMVRCHIFTRRFTGIYAVACYELASAVVGMPITKSHSKPNIITAYVCSLMRAMNGRCMPDIGIMNQ